MVGRRLSDDTAGVSPVIAVILMVAITVILSAVVGTFVLNIGSSVSETAPQASFEMDQHPRESRSGTSTQVTITMVSGDNINEENIAVTVNGERAFAVVSGGDNRNYLRDAWESSETITAGDSINVAAHTDWFDTNDDHEAFHRDKDRFFFGARRGNCPCFYYEAHSHSHLKGWGSEADWQLQNGDTVRVTWTSPSGDTQTILAEHEVVK